MNTEKSIEKIFKSLEDWIALPKYQAERRLDIFFGVYMNDILKATLPEFFSEKDDLYLIPEFPLEKKKENEGDKDLSYNIDYLVVNRTQHKFYAIELKTDNKSVRAEQINYYRDFIGKEYNDLNLFVTGIFEKDDHDKKYDTLYDRIQNKSGLPDCQNSGKVIYLIPRERISVHKKVYTEEKLKKNGFDVVTFPKIAEALKTKRADDMLLNAFLKFIESIN